MQDTTQSATNPGASNAADFQPGTQNPQTAAPTQLVPATGSLQSGDQGKVLENRNTTITVPTVKPATNHAAEATPTNHMGTILFVLVVIAAVLALTLWRRRRPIVASSEVAIPEETIEEPAPSRPVKTQPPKPVAKKSAPKKSKSQRKKRARR